MLRTQRALTSLALGCSLALALPLGAAEFTKSIYFDRGRSSASVQGSVVRGDQDVYLINVSAGQVMSVKASALENNVAFSIFEPGATRPIPGTESDNDLTAWRGTLLKSGPYRIVVGGTRGNATYKLDVAVN